MSGEIRIFLPRAALVVMGCDYACDYALAVLGWNPGFVIDWLCDLCVTSSQSCLPFGPQFPVNKILSPSEMKTCN